MAQPPTNLNTNHNHNHNRNSSSSTNGKWWSSIFSQLNPVPGFPEYTGTYQVGTIDVEIPVADLESPAPAPAEAEAAARDIDTIQFRVFYPCSSGSNSSTTDASKKSERGRGITWLPAPQREHLSAYMRFLGAGPLVAQAASFLPRHLHYTTIPAHENAALHDFDSDSDSPSSSSSKNSWPTVIFSHGLGGSRNAYSRIAGSLASHGLVVVCPEHRDGSAVASYIRNVPDEPQPRPRRTQTENENEKDDGSLSSSSSSSSSSSWKKGNKDEHNHTSATNKHHRRQVPYLKISHDATDEVHEARNVQLRIRLWELGLVYSALLALDSGAPQSSSFRNLDHGTPRAALDQFRGRLAVREPGSMIFAGHSFGGATVVQFLKSVFYAGRLRDMKKTTTTARRMSLLYEPSRDSAIVRQVTNRNVAVLLDMWCFPLLAKTTAPLFDLPLPCYVEAEAETVDGDGDEEEEGSSKAGDPPPPPGGNALLAIESEAFYKWTEHLHGSARVFSPDPSAPVVRAEAFAPLRRRRRPEGGRSSSSSRLLLAEPHFFYVRKSAHLNQSDFGVLFPWLTKKVFGADDPDQVIRLNIRAILQVLRQNGVPVGRTAWGDLVDGGMGERREEGEGDGLMDDKAILERHPTAGEAKGADGDDDDGPIRSWRWISIVGKGQVVDAEGNVKGGKEAAEQQEPEMASTVEPNAVEESTERHS
ncbi:platelet-activating factor acetylhydrolase, isoform II-domain-containing protein [Xylariomycetidae sp. FL2044]|nr:platelet-activating factor acetylhydrolase, isoform II-domain-containing protein [Xylariomycetidae sp. FL2044]